MISPTALVSATSTLSGVEGPKPDAGIPTIGIETNDSLVLRYTANLVVDPRSTLIKNV